MLSRATTVACRRASLVTPRSRSLVPSTASSLLPANPLEKDTTRTPQIFQPSCPPFHFQRRYLSSTRSRDNSKKTDPTTLSNENLIRFLMEQHPAAEGPSDVAIRLIIDQGLETPSINMECSLAQAIEESLDRNVDLVGASIHSDPPVVRATSLSKLSYRKGQSKQQQQKKNTKQSKSFRFRAMIDDHDLERKISDMKRSLDSGMDCDYSVFSKARVLRSNENAGMELVDRIQELIAAHGTLKRPPQVNEQGSLVQVQLVPKKS